ncbi:hypothetical protein HaLaN_26616, partial [Haematococcus lacustris]
MSRFNTFLEEVKTYCESYAAKGILATASRFLLYLKHKQRYDELVTELRDLTMDEELKKYLAGLKVRWGVWWTVFPCKLTLNDTLDEAAQKK